MSRGVVIGGSGHIGAISRRGWFPRDSKSLPSVADKGRRISRLTPGNSRTVTLSREARKDSQSARSRNAGTEHLGRRTVRYDTAACQDEPVAASFLNSQDAPRPRDRISERYLLRTIATVARRRPR